MSQPPKETHPVIIKNSWGRYTVYPATVLKARHLLEEQLAGLGDSTPMRILKNWHAGKDPLMAKDLPYLVADNLVIKALKELTTVDIDAPSRPLYRLVVETPEKEGTTPVSREWRDAFVLWAFDTKFKLDEANASSLNQREPEKSLPFFQGLVARAKGRKIKYVHASDMDDATELQQLLYGGWKETANVPNVVQRYLRFLESNSHRDETYHIGDLELPA